jgi:hypothetical protein
LLVLRRSFHQMGVVEAERDGTDMGREGLGKRQRLTHPTGDALSQRVMEPLAGSGRTGQAKERASLPAVPSCCEDRGRGGRHYLERLRTCGCTFGSRRLTTGQRLQALPFLYDLQHLVFTPAPSSHKPGKSGPACPNPGLANVEVDKHFHHILAIFALCCQADGGHVSHGLGRSIYRGV